MSEPGSGIPQAHCSLILHWHKRTPAVNNGSLILPPERGYTRILLCLLHSDRLGSHHLFISSRGEGGGEGAIGLDGDRERKDVRESGFGSVASSGRTLCLLYTRRVKPYRRITAATEKGSSGGVADWVTENGIAAAPHTNT
ncbi:hypothetical protein DPEC_G00176220 [Dallia pectoralis]|uniref:Uncharacterized protein n=1 Tax=Dallia pectoralis TaxID=75939 RepID=A0ACC2GF10_DALPE|nr:hypothetical protein DPEC_G00176220 [Dallia pectoralis]